MKKLLFILSLGAGFSAAAQHTVDCSYTSISGTIAANTTLYANTLYRLEGCVQVSTGVTLTIQAGTRILAEKASNAALYIAPGAYINAQGTSSSPIVFTSDQEPGYRDYGDWQGVIIGGYAYNNVPSTGLVALSRNCTVTGGGSNDADSSGVFRYVQINSAKYGLELISVGSKTAVDHIEVSTAAKNAFSVYGGAVNLKYLVSMNARQDDYYLSYGYQGRIQFALAHRADAAAHDAAASYGLFIENNPVTASATRYTAPVISNMTLLGPAFCNAGTLSSDFKDAILLKDYVRGGIYNSVAANWPGNGFYMDGSNTIANTASGNLNASYNAFDANGQDYGHAGSWTSACNTSMTRWFENIGAASCNEAGNQLSGFGPTGYDNTLICSTTTPDFRPDNTTALDAPDYTAADLGNAFFDDAFTFRGAFDQSSNWTAEWTDFNPLQTDYCTQSRTAAARAARNSQARKLAVYPNPAVNTTVVGFEAAAAGKARVLVLDKVSGRMLREQQVAIAKGSQHITIDLSGLHAGSYILRVETADGQVLHNQVMVAD